MTNSIIQLQKQSNFATISVVMKKPTCRYCVCFSSPKTPLEWIHILMNRAFGVVPTYYVARCEEQVKIIQINDTR